MTKQENLDWLELCKYFKKQILEYPDEMKFPKELVLRLKGLRDGVFIANNNSNKQAEYDFKTILVTCKVCKSKIVNYLHNNQTKINDEKHRINLAMKFIEQEINDVYIRLQQAKQTKERLEKIDMSNQSNDGAEYQTKGKNNEKLKDLW